MLTSSASPAAPIDTRAGPGIAVDRVGTATIISQVDTILPTAGSGADYTAASARGDVKLRDGLSLLLRIDRISPESPTFSIDGSPRAPVVDASGGALPAGALQPGYLQRVIYDARRGIWLGERFGSLTVPIFDALMRLWYLSLPVDTRGIGPNAPYRNNGVIAWTGPTNPSFTIDSPQGRRDTLRLIAEALPTSPDDLEPGEAWLNNNTITFVPQP